MSEEKAATDPSAANPSAEAAANPAADASSRFAVAAVALVLGTVALLGARSMSELGSVFPISAGLVLVIGGLASAALGWRARRDAKDAAAGKPTVERASHAPVDAAPSDTANVTDSESAAVLQRVSWTRWIAVVIALIAWAVLLDPLGFLASSALGMLAITLATWREPVSPAAVAGHLLVFATLLGGFYAIMRFVLRIAVP